MEFDNSMLVKDDINFLENPNWIVSKRDYPKELIIQKEYGFYELKCSHGLPVRFDKLVLYYLLHKLLKESDFNSCEISITRYEIAKNVFSQSKNFSKAKYDRIMLALKRWQAVVINFGGSFFEVDGFKEKCFTILDGVTFDKKTKKISIIFNALYIHQLKETRLYNYINFYAYKKLARPVSMRLYELLLKSFMFQSIWFIYLDSLCDVLTLGKRTFPSQALVALKPAIEEVNTKAHLHFDFTYDKASGICVFKKTIRT